MKRSAIETLLGAFVLAVAGFFLVFSYQTAHVGSGNGYMISADFSGIGGLSTGDDVVISGVKIGTVTSVDLQPDTFLARVNMEVQNGVKLPVDTAALISSQSLLGGRYLALEPGAEEEIIPEGGHIQFTQAPQNLEQLLGQFIFSMKDGKDKQASATQASAPAIDVSPVEAVAPKAAEPAPAITDAPKEEAPQEESAAPVSEEEPAHP